MEKKNTMLLTVIAVATLLVAVVGATFAYFSVSTSNSSQTVNVTGQTTAVGSATMTTPVTAMHLNLTGAEMAESLKGTGKYYSATGDEDYLTSAQPVNIAEMKVTGGDATVSYTCDYELTITRGATDTMIAKMVANDGKLVLAGDSITGTKEHALTTITAEGVKVAGTVSNLSTAASEFVTAYVEVDNTTAEQGFANTNLAIEIKATAFTCTINE